MAVFRQMRTAVEFATLKQNAANSGGWQNTCEFASPPSLPKMPIYTRFGVVAIRNKVLKGKPVPKAGLVAASKAALRDIAAMSAHKAKNQLIKGVPYVVRKQGANALAAQIEKPKDTSGRYSLLCNTGPKGSGKTVLQRQNMLQVARDFGFLAVEIEFNGIQSVGTEGKAKFTRRVANRILCYLPKYWGMDWPECLEAIAKDFEGKDKSPLSSITRAVEELKKALNHKGPVLLAVDELAMAPRSGKRDKKGNLSELCLIMQLCGIMDDSLDLSANNRIFLAVSVYDLVDLGALATRSSRTLLHQELPPILPVMLDSAVLTRLPVWLQVFFNKKKREKMKLKLASDMGGAAKLLAESGGHPRRIEALIEEMHSICSIVENKANNKADAQKKKDEAAKKRKDEVAMKQKAEDDKKRKAAAIKAKIAMQTMCEADKEKMKEAAKKQKQKDAEERKAEDAKEKAEAAKKRKDEAVRKSQVLSSQLRSVDFQVKACLKVMDAKLGLRATGVILSSLVKDNKLGGRYKVALVLLKYLFVSVNMDHPDARILRKATMEHYQLVPHDKGHVGYLPLPALQEFCKKLPQSNKNVNSFLKHAKGVADANLSVTSDTKTKTKERSKHFEMGMFHALCGAVLAEEGVTEEMFRHSPDNLPETRCAEIECAEDVKLFPNAVENGKTLRVCDDETLDRISKVGAFNARKKKKKSFKGLAFVPTDEGNTCCDFVLVLPTADPERAGRVVFAVQCKHWAEDVAASGNGLDALAHFRYGRHCFEAEKVFLNKNKKGADKRYAHPWGISVSHTARILYRIKNGFRKKFCDMVNENKDTRVVFVLATVNEMPRVWKKSVFEGVNLPDEKYNDIELQEDEGLMDLQHMCGWCPTVGYGALLAEKLREFPISKRKRNYKPKNKEKK